jgi:tyrosyl-tRNA synthetase
MKLSEELSWRGFVNQTTLRDPSELDTRQFTFYWGVDPSAPSMTIGNLAAAMMARHFMMGGHKAVLLIGGATGLIGDPDGKKEERVLKPVEEIEANKRAIVEQYRMLFAGLEFQVVDNLDWFNTIGYLEFLRDVGKHVPMRQMLGRDFVQTRLSDGGAGISYAEFSYVLIQAYDFLYLHRTKSVDLQLCGSDQWGNSIAGVDLIRRLTGNESHVWSTPLVINKSTGQKFGKSESGAIWLEATMTSPYKFYQFWLNSDDEGVEDYLKIYTLLTKEEIEALVQEFTQNKSERSAQKRLAFEVTKIVHGEDLAKRQEKIAHSVFDTDHIRELEESDWTVLTEELPYFELSDNVDATALLVEAGLAASNTQARRFISDGALYINNQQIVPGSANLHLKKDMSLHGFVLVRRGKNTQMVVKIK